MNGIDRTSRVSKTAALAMFFTMAALITQAQDAPLSKSAPPMMSRMERQNLLNGAPTRTFYLKYAIQMSDANEIFTALRNMLDPDVKSFLVPEAKAIVVRGLPDDFARVTQLLSDLDRPRISYRLTYTVSEVDGTRTVSTQRHVLSIQDGQELILKQGSRVPVTIAKPSAGGSSSENQMTYLDIGQTFDATISGLSDSASLKSSVEQSSLVDEKPVQLGNNPTIRQTVLRGVYLLPLGKQTALGSLDLPGTTHHLEIQALVEKQP